MKKIVTAFMAFALCAGTVGCNDYLDTMPDNRTQIDNLEKVEALLVSAYPFRSFAAIIEASCDGYIDHGSTYDGSQPNEGINISTERAFLWSEYPPAEGSETTEQYWGACYAAVAAANIALQAMDEMVGNGQLTEAEVKPFRAEAKLCRAYAHFCLLTLYSNFFDSAHRDTNPGVPYVTEPENVVFKPYDRETVAAILEKVKIDLEEGMENIGTSKNKFHFSRSAALAFATRVALFEGDYPAVLMYVNELIPTAADFINLGTNADGSQRRIPTANDMALLFAKNNLANWDYIGSQPGAEAVMQAASDPRYQPSILLCSEVYSLLNRINMGNGLTRYALSERQMNNIAGNNATGVQWNYPVYSFPNAVGFIPKYYEDFKITNITASTGIPHVKSTLFRLEEMLLARAEARILSGNYDQALDDLNVYTVNRLSSSNMRTSALTRDKVLAYYAETLDNPEHWINSPENAVFFSAENTTPTGRLERALILTVLDFRRSEFTAEGMRWFDILRWNIPVTHKRVTGAESTLAVGDDRRVLQIPATAELSGLEKNPRTTPDW